MNNPSTKVRAGSLRLFLVALFMALLIPVTAASAADKVANPGPFTATISGGMLGMHNGTDFEVPISDIQPAPVIQGTIDADGNILVDNSTCNQSGVNQPPSCGVIFPGLDFDLDGNQIQVYVMASGSNWTGQVDPDSGEMTLDARLRIRGAGKPMGIDLGSSCYVGAAGTGNNIWLNPVTTGTIPANDAIGPMSGIPYDADSGKVTLVNNTASVPAGSGCGPLGLADGTLNGELGLPSPSGKNEMSLEIDFTSNAPQAPAVSRYTATPQQGRIPFDVDFDASASTSTLGEIDTYNWDFDGDGTVDQTTTEPTVTHTYDTTGVFKTKLTIASQGYETTRSRATITARAVIASFTQTPQHFQQSRDATFAFEANEAGATFECKLLKNGTAVSMDDPNGAPGEDPVEFEACVSPVSFTGLDDADYSMSVRAVGGDDGAKGLPAVWDFRIDNVPPITTITSRPPAYYNQLSFPFEFTANEPGATFECRVLQDLPVDPDNPDAEPAPEPEFAACATGDELSWADVEGPVEIQVRATDRAGNLGDSTSANIVLDRTPPTSTVSYGPPNPTNAIGGNYAEKCDGNFFECLIKPKTEVTTVGNTAQRFDFAADGTEPDVKYICQFNDEDERGCQSGVQTGTGVSNPSETWSLNQNMRRVGNPDQGNNTFKVWAVDRAGNRQADPTVYNFVFDNIAPKVTALAKPAVFTKSVNNTVIFKSDEPVTKFECKVINNTGATTTGFPTGTGAASGFAPCDPGQILPDQGWYAANGQTEGRKGLQVRATDLAGNTQTSNNGVLNDGALNVWWTVDTTAPVASFASGSVQEGSNTTATTATINLGSTDTPINFGVNANGIAPQQPAYECSLNNAAFAPCVTPVELTGLAPGENSFRLRVTDQATNVSAIIERKWTVVDASNASVSLNSKPASLIGVRTATYDFTPDGGTAECRIDATEAQNAADTGWVPCASPHSFTGLADGNHQAEIRADSNSVPVVDNFAVYANLPTVTINQQPGIARPDGKRYTGLGQDEATITFSSPDNPAYAPGETTFECRYYDTSQVSGPWESCESPYAVNWDKNSNDTVMKFEVRPTSSTGNLGGEKNADWTIDSVKPTVALGNAGTVDTACGNGVINGSGPAGCVATGNSTQPGLRSNVSAARFQATSSDPVNGAIGFACQLNDGPRQNPCTARTSGFPAGGNPLTVVLGSSRGNSDNLGSSAQGGAIATNAVNVMKVWAVSDGGNESDPVSYTWTHDNTVPTFAINADAPARTNKGTAADPLVVEIEASEDMAEEKGFACRLINNGTTSTNGTNPGGNPNSPGSGWVTCPMDLVDPQDPGEGFKLKHATWTADNLAEGNYALDIRGWDTVWNVATGTNSSSRPNVADWNSNGKRYLFTVDRVAPTVNITAGPAEASTVPGSGGEFTFTPSEPAGQIEKTECRIDPVDPQDVDTQEWETCSGSFEFSDLEDGAHVFQVRSLDTAGNQGNPTTRNWTVDSTMPEITLSSNLTGAVTNQSAAEFTFTVNPADSTLECRLVGPEGYPVPVLIDPEDPDGGYVEQISDEFAACASPVELTDMVDGEYTLEVKATNTLGTEGEIARKSWTVDTVIPVATLTQKPAAETKSTSAEFKFTSDKANGTFECELDGGAAQDCDSPKSYTGLSDGTHTFTVIPGDTAGNVGSPVSYSWKVDTVAPVTTITDGPSGTVQSKSAEFKFSADKVGSTFECQFNGSAWASCLSPKEFTGLTNGLQTFRVRATDPLGNVGSGVERNWAVDVPQCPPGQIGEWPDCQAPVCPPDKVGEFPDCFDPCPTGWTGTPPNCEKPPPAVCETGQLGTPPNCVTPLPPKKPDNVTGAYDPATGKLQIRLKCPKSMKPKCIGNAVAVSGKGKKAKVMSSKVKSNSKAGKWKLVTITIKKQYRSTVEGWTTVNQKKLIIRQTVKSKKNKKKRDVFHTYKVRVKG